MDQPIQLGINKGPIQIWKVVINGRVQIRETPDINGKPMGNGNRALAHRTRVVVSKKEGNWVQLHRRMGKEIAGGWCMIKRGQDVYLEKLTSKKKLNTLQSILKMPRLHDLSLQECGQKLFDSERTYVELGLRVLVRQFKDRLDFMRMENMEIPLQEVDQKLIFGNISEIHNFHENLFAELYELRLQGEQHFFQELGRKMCDFIPYFKLYSTYIAGYNPACEQLKKLEEHSPWMKFVEINQKCVWGEDDNVKLSEALKLPVFRLPQYLAFLGGIHRKLDDPSWDNARGQLEKAIISVKNVADQITNTIKDTESRKGVVRVQEYFLNSLDIIAPHRVIIREGDLRLVTNENLFTLGTTEYLFVLFNDMLIAGTRVGVLFNPQVKYVLRIEGMEVEETEHNDFENVFTIHDCLSESLVLIANSSIERNNWINDIKNAVDKLIGNVSMMSPNENIESAEDFKNRILKKPNSNPTMIRRPPRLQKKILNAQQLRKESVNARSLIQEPKRISISSNAEGQLPVAGQGREGRQGEMGRLPGKKCFHVVGLSNEGVQSTYREYGEWRQVTTKYYEHQGTKEKTWLAPPDFDDALPPLTPVLPHNSETSVPPPPPPPPALGSPEPIGPPKRSAIRTSTNGNATLLESIRKYKKSDLQKTSEKSTEQHMKNKKNNDFHAALAETLARYNKVLQTEEESDDDDYDFD